MDDEKLDVLKQKADAGDAEACFEYSIKIHNRDFESDKKLDKDFKESWDYLLKAKDFEQDEDSDLSKKIQYNLYIVYQHAIEHKQINRLDKIKEHEYKIYYWKYEATSMLGDLLAHIDQDLNDESIEFIKWVFEDDSTSELNKICASYLLAHSIKETNAKKYFYYLEFCSKNDYWKNKDIVFYEIGKCYFDGYGVKKDYEKAREYLEKSDNQGAYYLLGKICEEGLGCTKDTYKAYSYYDKGYTDECRMNKAKIIYDNCVNRFWNIDNAIKEYERVKEYGDSSAEAKHILKEIEELKKKEETDCLRLNNVPNSQLDKVLRNEIDNIINKIEYISKIKTNPSVLEKIKKIKIVYSYEKKKEEDYFDIDEVIAEIKDLINDLRNFIKELELKESDYSKTEIENIYSIIEILENLLKYLENKDINEDKLKGYADFLDEKHLNDDNIKLYKKFEKIKNRLRKRVSLILGEYDHLTKEITMYLKNIYDSSINEGIDKEIYCLNVFAHEIFHAYHALLKEAHGTSWFDYEKYSAIVIESLARYFEYYYAEKAGDDIPFEEDPHPNHYSKSYDKNHGRKDLYVKLKKKVELSFNGDIYCDPYSGAAYYSYNKTKFGENIFRRVYEESLNSFSSAFDILKLLYDMDNMD